MNVEDAIYQLHELEADLRCSSQVLKMYPERLCSHVVQRWLDRANSRLARALEVLRDGEK